MSLSTIAALSPLRTSAQDAAMACVDEKELPDGPKIVSVLASDPAGDGRRTVRREYGSVRLEIPYRAERSDGTAARSRTLYLGLTQPNGGGRTELRLAGSAWQCPTVTCDPEEDLQFRYKVDNQAFARHLTTQSAERALTLRDRPLLLTYEQEQELRNGRTLWVEIATRRGWERGEISIRNLDQWLKEAERFHRTRLRAALADTAQCLRDEPDVVTSPCYMTTLITHELGRGPECFELNALNELTPNFAQYPDHIAQYVRDAAEIGARKGEPMIWSALLVFYVVSIWPAALLIKGRALLPAGLWYFAGFTVLKLLHKATLPRLQKE